MRCNQKKHGRLTPRSLPLLAILSLSQCSLLPPPWQPLPGHIITTSILEPGRPGTVRLKECMFTRRGLPFGDEETLTQMIHTAARSAGISWAEDFPKQPAQYELFLNMKSSISWKEGREQETLAAIVSLKREGKLCLNLVAADTQGDPGSYPYLYNFFRRLMIPLQEYLGEGLPR